MRRVLVGVAVGLVGLAGARFEAAPPQDALAQLREALGGEAALNAVRTIRARGKIKFKPYDDHFEIAVARPDRFVSIVRMFRMNDAAWSTSWGYSPGSWEPRLEPILVGADPTPHEQVTGFNGDLLLPSGIEWSLQDPHLARLLDGRRARMAEFVLPLLAGTSSIYPVVARSESHAVHFSAVGSREWRLELDPETHLPARMIWTYPLLPGARAGAKPMTVRTEFSDFRIVSGLRWPHRLVTQRDGKPLEDASVQRYEVNVNLDKMFRR